MRDIFENLPEGKKYKITQREFDGRYFQVMAGVQRSVTVFYKLTRGRSPRVVYINYEYKHFLNNLYHGPIRNKCFNNPIFDESRDVILMGLCNHEWQI